MKPKTAHETSGKISRDTIHAIIPFIDDCNLHCFYCCSAEAIETADPSGKRLKRDEWQAFVRFFNTLETGNWIVHMTSGEPFCHPEFIDFAVEITQKNRINIGTNLSFDLKDFIRRVPPDRVATVACTLQPEMEGHLDDFIQRLLLLKERNYNVQAAYVMAPARFKRFSEYREIIEKNTGIHLVASPFIWRNNGKEYPGDYSEEEKEFLLENCYSPVRAALSHIAFPLRETNKICAAGFNSVAVDVNGDIFRCHDRWEIIGNIHRNELHLHPRPEKCRQRFCMCPSALAAKTLEARYVENYLSLPAEEKRRLAKKAKLLLRPRRDYETFWRNLETECLARFQKEFERKFSGKRVVLSPAGATTRMLLGAMPNTMRNQVVGITDRRPGHVAPDLRGFRVVSHEEMESLKPDVILILSERFADELARKFDPLRARGVECIINPVPFYTEDGYKVF